MDAAQLEVWVRTFAVLVTLHEAAITELDSVIGDGDHGENLRRGMTAVLETLDTGAPAQPGPFLKLVGRRLAGTVGGTSGALYGTFFMRMGTSAGTTDPLTVDDLAIGFRAGLDGLLSRGKAEPGDKTMCDAVIPAVEAFEKSAASGATINSALEAALNAAQDGRDATAAMTARKGRASYLGTRSLGHIDAGATSATLLFEAAITSIGSIRGASPKDGALGHHSSF